MRMERITENDIEIFAVAPDSETPERDRFVCTGVQPGILAWENWLAIQKNATCFLD